MKSPLQSRILIASLAANVALVAVGLTFFWDFRETSPATLREPATATPTLKAFPIATQVATSSSESDAVTATLPSVASLSPAPLPASVLPVAVSSPQVPNIAFSGYPPTSSYQSTSAVEEEDPSLGPANPVNPATRGNSFIAHGMRVAVAATYPNAKGGGTPLGIDLTPVGPFGSEDVETNELSASQTAATETPDTNGGNSNKNRRPGEPTPASPSGSNPLTDSMNIDEFQSRYGTEALGEALTAAKIAADNETFRRTGK